MHPYNSIWITLIFCILGYFIGSVNFSLLITEKLHKRPSIRNFGSGNPGATNALRSFGWKFGLLIFFLDVSKSYWFAFILGIIEQYAFGVGNQNMVYPQVATIFVVVGHIWPIFFKFKGGKGAATCLGLIVAISLILAAIGAVLFIIIVLSSRYVSLGSIIVPQILSFLSLAPYLHNYYDSVINTNNSWLSFLAIFIASLFVIYCHKDNIKRLFSKTETKLGKINKFL